MSDTREVALTPTHETQSGKQVLQKERDHRPASHTTSFDRHDRPSGVEPGSDQAHGTHAPAVLQQSVRTRTHVTRPLAGEAHSSPAASLQEASSIDDRPRSRASAAERSTTAVRAVAQALAEKAVPNFAVPRRPKADFQAPPEEKLSAAAQDDARGEPPALPVALMEEPGPLSSGEGTVDAREEPQTEVEQGTDLDEITAKRIAIPKTQHSEVAQEPEPLSSGDERVDAREEEPGQISVTGADPEASPEAGVAALPCVDNQAVAQAQQERAVPNFAVPRRPKADIQTAQETKLPAVAQDVAEGGPKDASVAAREEEPGPIASAVAEPEAAAGADVAALPTARIAVATPLVWKQETYAEPPAYELSVVVPTKDERESVCPLLVALREALAGLQVEVIFVDDSRDQTQEVIKDAAAALCTESFQVQVFHRPAGGELSGGLATAVALGMSRAQAEYVAVIDADLQHPPEQLRVLYEQAADRNADVVVASRYLRGGSNGGLDGAGRRAISIAFTWAARLLFPEHVLAISDPMSGFFVVRRKLVEGTLLRPLGYKILLEVLVRCSWRQALEVPYQFGARAGGRSKSNVRQGLLALAHMLRLWREVPSAGRVWKIALLLLANVLVALAWLHVGAAAQAAWSGSGLLAFGLMGCLDFVLVSRAIFPRAPTEGGGGGQTAHAIANLVDSFTGRTSALLAAVSSGRIDPAHERLWRFASIAVVLLTLAWIAYVRPGATLTLAVLCIGLPLALAKSKNREQAVTRALSVAVVVATVDYLSWRLGATNWQGWWLALPLLFAEALGAMHVLGFQLTVWPWPTPQIARGQDPTQLPIFIFIPTVNEGPAILRPTIAGALSARARYLARYPHAAVTIAVCNDGRVAGASCWQETEQLSREMGVLCITRTSGGGAKAGNIEHAREALAVSGQALLVIFDADQVARPEFLLKTVSRFCDPQMGWVQSGQYYTNLENPVARWADDQQAMFYQLLCPGKEALNAAFICGTNVVIRAAALDEIGGLPQDSVTEDFAASIALHTRWRSSYLKEVLATGLGPLDIPSYLKQQGRWSLGTLGVLRSHWRDIVLPKKGGLRLGQRAQYLLACTHYLCGLRDLIYLLSPLLFLLTGIPAVRSAYLSDYLWHFLPYCLLSLTALWYAGRGVTGLRGIVIGFGSFPALLGSLLSVALGRRVGFAVTAKHRSGKSSLGYLWPYVVLLLLCVAGLCLAARVRGAEQAALFVSVLWILYSMLLLLGFLWLALADLRFHAAARPAGAVAPLQIQRAKATYPDRRLQRSRGLRPLFNLALAAMLAAPILAASTNGPLALLAAGPPAPFAISGETLSAPYLGLSLPEQLLFTQPAELSADLGARFAIIGRTQVISDRFDATWANRLAAEGARPWITLQFGVFGADGKPPIDASLLAIINGVQDGAITRWASEIRAYGKPVYLTILQHADRNWSLSSGVANGGIPEDVPRAWLHVQALFRAAGADNVAWVWAPADPTSDQQFAPPAASIDAVLQSFINYPGTPWGDPGAVLQQLVRRYPTRPIFVEASAAGPPAQKAQWLSRLGQAVEDNRQVYALLYHEGGPGLAPNSAQIQSWSLASDPASVAAMRQIVAGLRDLHQRRAFS